MILTKLWEIFWNFLQYFFRILYVYMIMLRSVFRSLFNFFFKILSKNDESLLRKLPESFSGLETLSRIMPVYSRAESFSRCFRNPPQKHFNILCMIWKLRQISVGILFDILSESSRECYRSLLRSLLTPFFRNPSKSTLRNMYIAAHLKIRLIVSE